MKHSMIAGKLRSPLSEAMVLNPSQKSRKRKMVMGLVLTSLVDAFSIMLLYLLVQNTGNGSTVELSKTDKLPTASKAEALHKGTMIRVEGKRYFLDNQPVEAPELAARLQQLHASRTGEEAVALIIQADRNNDFQTLTPIIRAGSISGFNKFKFAVLQGEGEK